MAGIGVRLNKIYNKRTMLTSLVGAGYSTVITVLPMFLVIVTITLMDKLLGVSEIVYASRELYSATILYIFIFALITASPFNAVLSRYLSDVIYEETYADILPCYYVGLLINLSFSCLIGIPFCIWEYKVGKISLFFIFLGYCGYVIMVILFYSMLYLSICKSYGKITWFFLVGMAAALLLSLLFVYVFRMETTTSMLLALDIGFLLTTCLEWAQVKSYFRYSSKKYKAVFAYFKKYWQLVLTNFFYMLGLYVHNFVFWTTDLRMEVAGCFVSAPSYDMASCLGMFTNITASILFISRVEMRFNEKYRGYSEAVIGGRGMDIDNAKKRMFHQLSSELIHLVRDQFVISIIIYFLFVIFLPRLGFGGLVMQIYPCLAAGYFIWFILNAAIIFLYYYSDLNGALCAAAATVVATLAGSIVATKLSPMFYGIGLIFGTLVGFSVAYYRLRTIEKTLDVHIFCNGNIMKKGSGRCPSNKVFDRYALVAEQERREKKKKKKKMATKQVEVKQSSGKQKAKKHNVIREEEGD